MKKLFNKLNLLTRCLLLTLALLSAANTFVPKKAIADTTYPDSNGNGIPNWVESTLTGACASSGNHTYHLVWFHPATLNPPYGATSDSTSLKSVAYICPGVSYTYSSNITHTITGNDSRLSFPSGRTFYMGTAYRGGFSSVATLPVNIQLTGISYDNWNYFNINYWGYAYPGGNYDCFVEPGCTPTSTSVGVYIVRPAQPYNSGTCTVSAPSSVAPGSSFSASFTVTNTGNYYTWSVDPVVSDRYRLVSINAPAGSSWSGRTLNIPGYASGYGLVIYPTPTPVPNGYTTPTTFTATFTAPATAGNYTFSWSIVKTSSHPALGGSPTCTRTITVTQPQPTFQCLDLETTISPRLLMNDGETFGLVIGMSFTGLTPTRPTYQLDYSIPGLSLSGTDVPYTVASGKLTYTTPTRTPAPGIYPVTWNIRGPTTKSCSGEFVVTKKPYVRIYGGDAIAGAGFIEDGSCENSTTANLRAYDTSSPTFSGSGTQIANYALNLIQGLPSAMARGSGSARSLSFANSGSGIWALWSAWGGSWGSQYVECIPDYWNSGDRPPNPNIGATFDPSANSQASGGSYLSSGDVTISSATTINDSRRIKLFVNGDVYIENNALYNGFAFYSRPEDIPNLTVVALGNIYIGNQVTALSGKYVAQNGSIYTCTFGFSNHPNKTQLNSTDLVTGCQRKLTIYGSLIANSIKFQRSRGSLKGSTADEARSGTNIAEVIQYSPEIWLGDMTTTPSKYDSITSLPPVL